MLNFVVRNCTEIPLDPFRNEFGIKSIYNVSLFVDEKNKSEIFKVLSEQYSVNFSTGNFA